MPTRLWIVLGVALLGNGAATAQVALIDPPDRVARLSYVEGAVALAPAAAGEWVDATLNRPLTRGDRVWVNAASRAELQIDTVTIHIDENTALSFVALDDGAIRLRLIDGAIALHVRSLGAHETITVETHNTIVVPRQAGEYAVATDASRQTVVQTRRGACDVSGGTPQSYLVGADEQGVFAGDPLQVSWVTLQPRSAFAVWSNVREDGRSRSVARRYVAAGTIGYEDLDAYGRWSHEPQYGDVWRPTTIAERDWAPYRYGRWVWVSPWGWTWIDDTPWGFAPFHYGRWAYVRQHWCWVPGPPRERAIYAPALVAWAGDPGRGFDNVGWFPLGPRDIYLPGYRASWRHFRAINSGNAARLDDAALTAAYHGRHSTFDYRNRNAPHALTIVSHAAFVSGLRTRGPHVDIDPNTTQRWREQGRAPDIQPNRLSVLGAEPARRPPVAHHDRPELHARPAAPLDGGHAAWAPQPGAPVAEPPGPEQPPRPAFSYAKVPKQQTPAPAAPTVSTPSPREWVAPPRADGETATFSRHGPEHAGRTARDPGNAGADTRSAPRGGEAAPPDLTH